MVERRLTLESARSDGRPSNGDSFRPAISDDGRFVVFESSGQLTSGADQLVQQQVVLRDRQLGITSILSANRAGDLGNKRSGHPVVSADGGVVAFESSATNLVPGANARGSTHAVYAATLATRDIVPVSLDSADRQADHGASYGPGISADGMRIAFTSTAPLAAEDDVRDPTRGTQRAPWPHVFVRDLAAGTTRRVSRISTGEPDGPSYLAAISSDGRWVTFVSDATNLVRGDKNGASDVFLHDLHTSRTSLVSRSASGGTANGASTRPAISADGRFVAFESDASNLVCSRRCPPRDQDINLVSDIFLFDRTRDTMVRVGTDAESGWIEPSRSPAIAAHAPWSRSRRAGQ